MVQYAKANDPWEQNKYWPELVNYRWDCENKVLQGHGEWLSGISKVIKFFEKIDKKVNGDEASIYSKKIEEKLFEKISIQQIHVVPLRTKKTMADIEA